MINTRDFLETEEDGVLAQKNLGFIDPEDYQSVCAIIKRARRWTDLLKISSEDVGRAKEALDSYEVPPKPARILLADAERTFACKRRREKLVEVTAFLFARFEEYQQNVTFICSFLLLFLRPRFAAAVMIKLYEDELLLPGHFKAASEGAKVDMLLFMQLARREGRCNAAVAKLDREGVPPDFLKKWFSGLCVHVLPLAALFEYFEFFAEEGFLACLKFGLAAFIKLEEEIVASKDIQDTMAVLHFDRKRLGAEKMKRVSMEILEMARDERFEVTENIDLKDLRSRVFKTEIEEKVLKADKYAEENPVDEIPVCELCGDGFQDLRCSDCNLIICEDCHECPPEKGGHKTEHEVFDFEEEENCDEISEDFEKLGIGDK
ncbi:TBC1 domain member 4 [Bonamia ostreae]|uniref:TBC1 domain member 4 n=1 Tax=Bonamia ostreae TaxID=126728 RepID=A0ABV2ANH4_9EUKA